MNENEEIAYLGRNAYLIKNSLFDSCVFSDYEIVDDAIERLKKSIDILKNEPFDLRRLNNDIFYSVRYYWNDLFYFKKYNECKVIINNRIKELDQKFETEKFKNDRATILKYEVARKSYNKTIAIIDSIIELTEEFRDLLFLAIDDLEIEINRLLSDYNLQNNSNIKTIIPLPTWADKTEMEMIWSELVSLKLKGKDKNKKFVDAQDKNNFLLVFGFGDKSKTYEKFSLGTSATNLRVLLTLMIDRTSKIPSVENRKIANDLFTIQLNKTTKPNEDDMNRWSGKLQQTDRLRTKPLQYNDDFEPIIE